MERLDYLITKDDGVEYRASYQQVIEYIALCYPLLWEEIEYKMRHDGRPFRYHDDGKTTVIEYRGPRPLEDNCEMSEMPLHAEK